MKTKNIDGETPARFIGVRALANHRKAFVGLLDSLPFRPGAVLDIRYGTGAWVREVIRRFSPVRVVAYERDAATVREAYRHPSVVLYGREWKPETWREPGEVDLLLADFTVSSALQRGPLDATMTAVRPRLVIFSDMACAKLRLNYRAYGLESPEMEEYWARFLLPGYRLIKWAQRHRTVSAALWGREEEGEKRNPGEIGVGGRVERNGD